MENETKKKPQWGVGKMIRQTQKEQEERYKSTQQLSNVEGLISELNSVDDKMETIHSILQTIQEKTLQGMSQSYSDDARAVLAKEIANKKEQILQVANSQFGGKYLFSGTNNSTPPFTVNEPEYFVNIKTGSLFTPTQPTAWKNRCPTARTLLQTPVWALKFLATCRPTRARRSRFRFRG